VQGRRFNCPWKKSYLTFIHFENLRLSRVLCTRDRLLRSGRESIHSLPSKRRRQGFNAGALGSVPPGPILVVAGVRARSPGARRPNARRPPGFVSGRP
jgi:hypothetical protein